MRILVLSNLYPPDVEGGYEAGCAQAVEALRRQGHAVSVLTSVPRRRVAPEPGVSRSLRLWPVYDPVLSNPAAPPARVRLGVGAEWIDAGNVHRLLDEVDGFHPDVVYVWNVEGIGGMGLLLALELSGLPWVMHLMDPVPGIIAALRGPRFSQVQRLFSTPLTGAYISCSRHVVEETRRAGVELAGPVELIPNWIQGPPPPPLAREALNRPLRIMMASVVTRFKGVDVMMEAAALLLKRGMDAFRVDVYGPVLDDSLYALHGELDLGDHFVLKGQVPQPELLEKYAAYDLFAFPTWPREAFGFAGLEAASRGCAVLMTAGCGLAEWLVDGVHCLKAERTPEGFARAVEQVMQGEIDIIPIAARAQQVVLRDFHLDVILPRIENVLEAAAAAPRSPGLSPERVYGAAVLAENLASVIIDEAIR